MSQIDFTDRVTDAATPAAAKLSLYVKGVELYTRDNTGTVVGPLGAASAGGFEDENQIVAGRVFL